MMTLSEYQVEEQLGDDCLHCLYRAARVRDGCRVLIKTLRPGAPFAESAARLAREFEIVSALDLVGITRVLELIEGVDPPMLVLEDFGGRCLQAILREGPPEFASTIRIAIQLAETISSLHHLGLVHRDIEPCNILIDPATWKAQVTGLGLASRVPRQYEGTRGSSAFKGALAYLSPEQTGRTNRFVDYRTDFYSLGVTLFEMLTGRLPFEADDPLELVHCHVAKRAPRPDAVGKAVPQVLSDIVLKLLSKPAEARYQSGTGLVRDLERCLLELETRGTIDYFDLGEHDVPARFELPQKLYGREKEIESLLKAAEATAEGKPRLILISGYAGVGKTALVQALRWHILKQSGFFVTGHYTENTRGTPYSGILEALRSMIRRLLAMTPQRIERYKRQLAESSGLDLGVMVEAIPVLRAVVGTLPPVPEMGPVESKRRFHRSILELMRIFAANASPLVLFLDDLQWIDPASLELIESTLEKGMGSLLLVGAYRIDEVGEGHILLDALSELENKGIATETLVVSPLGPQTIGRLVADALWKDESRAAPLADLVFRKAAGNPFLTRAFLTSLNDEGILRFDLQSGWVWDPRKIAELETDIGDLPVRRIAQLPEDARRTIALASALGHDFSATTLATVCELSILEVKSHLVAACRERVLLKDEDVYRFEHDRLKEAAYAVISEDKWPAVHLRIGRLLAQQTSRETNGPLIFDVVGHLNRAVSLIEKTKEREELARYNLSAGRKARSEAAYPAAFEYFSTGLALLPAGAWETNYELSLALHNEAAEAALLCADFSNVERLVKIVQENANTILDRIPAYEAQISTAHAQLRETVALGISLDVLKLLGITIPEKPSRSDVYDALRDLREMLDMVLSARREDEIDIMSEPSKLAAMRILARAIHTGAWSNYPLLHVMACKALELTVKYGHSPESPLAYLLVGFLMCYVLDDFESGYRAGVLALKLSERSVSARWRPFCRIGFHAIINSWKTPFRSLFTRYEETYRVALESGDFLSAVLTAYCHCETGLYSGMELSRLRELIQTYMESLRAAGLGKAAIGLAWLDRLVSSIIGGSWDGAGEAALTGEDWKAWRDSTDPVVGQIIYCHEMMTSHLFRDTKRAREVSIQITPHQVGRLSVTIPIHLYLCLGLIDQMQNLKDRERQEVLVLVESYLQSIALRARACPANYENRLLVAEAELHRVLGETDLAIFCYEKAISAARESGQVNEEAFASELAGEFFLELGSRRLAAVYMKAASSAYKRWGALRKVAQLSAAYPDLLAESAQYTSAVASASAVDSSLLPVQDALDMASIERAARTLAGELDLGRVIRKLMQLLIQTAGAQRGLLLRIENGGIFVEAVGSVDAKEIEVSESAASEPSEELCSGIVRYVSRSLETVVLGDVASDERFAGDPYIEHGGPKSILCAPLLHQSKQVGILYLENNRIRNAFNEAHLIAVQIISAQAAVALENARLHSSLREALQQVASLKDRLEAENVYLREEIHGSHNFEEIVGESAALKSALRKVDLVAPTEATVLILGETGTGKELIARAIHARSSRKNAPLVKLSCAALPNTLIESELFGHEKGAFTGAFSRRVGRFELADRGTIFLDEIGDLPMDLQVKLLRVLQEGEFERIGSGKTQKVDVRVIAATNRNLEQATAEGSFRQDLYYRLSVFPIRLPPLRDRREDIPFLLWAFIVKKQKAMRKNIEKVPKAAMDALMAYNWPGNVRELENVVERALILSSGSTLLIDESLGASTKSDVSIESSPENLLEVERAHVLRVIESCGWRIKGRGNAADKLGLHPNTLQSRMKKLGIRRPGACSAAPV